MSNAQTSPTFPADRGVGEAAALIADLAQRATGAVDLMTVELPEDGFDGLPPVVPVMVRSGVAGAPPEMRSLKALVEEWRTAPARRKGVARVTTLAAFIALVNRHKDDHSVLFARTEWPKPSLTGVIDYHRTDGAARFGEHRVRYEFPVTPEFAAWINLNGKPFTQADFARHIEDRIADLAVPSDIEIALYEALFRTKFAVPSELVDLARGLQVHVDAKVKNTFRLQSGEAEIVFETEHRDSNGEPIHVPGLFMLRLPAFLDGDPVLIVARLRYRVANGAVLWSYDLYQWEELLRRRVCDDFGAAAEATGLLAIEGEPETGAAS